MAWTILIFSLHFCFITLSRRATHSNHTTSCFSGFSLLPASNTRMNGKSQNRSDSATAPSFIFIFMSISKMRKNKTKQKRTSLERKIKGAFPLCAGERRAAGKRGWARQNGASLCVPRRVIKWVFSKWQKDSSDDDNGDESGQWMQRKNKKYPHTQTKWRQIAVKWFFKCVISR